MRYLFCVALCACITFDPTHATSGAGQSQVPPTAQCMGNADCTAAHICSPAFHCVTGAANGFAVTAIDGNGAAASSGTHFVHDGIALAGTALSGVNQIEFIDDEASAISFLTVGTSTGTALSATFPLALATQVAAGPHSGILRVVHATSGSIAFAATLTRGDKGAAGDAGADGPLAGCTQAIGVTADRTSTLACTTIPSRVISIAGTDNDQVTGAIVPDGSSETPSLFVASHTADALEALNTASGTGVLAQSAGGDTVVAAGAVLANNGMTVSHGNVDLSQASVRLPITFRSGTTTGGHIGVQLCNSDEIPVSGSCSSDSAGYYASCLVTAGNPSSCDEDSGAFTTPHAPPLGGGVRCGTMTDSVSNAIVATVVCLRVISP